MIMMIMMVMMIRYPTPDKYDERYVFSEEGSKHDFDDDDTLRMKRSKMMIAIDTA